MRRGREVRAQGFTLVELMIVIAIIAILASIAIPQYMKYQRKAKVSSYALPAARACAMDIAAFCVENPGQTYSPNATNSPNCNSSNTTIQTAGGQVTIKPISSQPCANDGQISGDVPDLVTATLDGVSDYRVRCEYKNQSVRCTVEGT